MWFKVITWRIKSVLRNFLPLQQVLADCMHNSLLGFALCAEMRIVSGVKDVVAPFAISDRAGEDKEVLVISGAARQHLAVLFEVNEIGRAYLVPWSPFAVAFLVAPIQKKEKVIAAVFIIGDEIRRPRSHWPVKEFRRPVALARRLVRTVGGMRQREGARAKAGRGEQRLCSNRQR